MEKDLRERKSFDVICAGEALWKLVSSRHSQRAPRLRPSGGAVNVALALAAEGLRVGLSTVLDDDDFGRTSVQKIAGTGVDTAGVKLARPRSGFILVDGRGGANQLPTYADEQEPLEVPKRWSSQILLLSGLSPVVSHAAALCKAARSARRQGSLVMIDFNASLHAWAGRDPRTIRMVLREVDIARCSIADLAVLGMDIGAVRAELRPTAVSILGDGRGNSIATGAFGEVSVASSDLTKHLENGSGDAFAAAVCKELLRAGDAGETTPARFHRVLKRGHAAVIARAERSQLRA